MPLHLKNLSDELKPLKEGKQAILRYNGPLSHSELNELLEAIPTLPSLKVLSLEQASLQQEDVKKLADALSQRDDLQELAISKTPLSDEGAVALSDALKKHKDLRSLQLSYCDLTEKGMDAFVDTISGAPHFRGLYASGNEWSQSNSDKLAVAISDKTELSALSLGSGAAAGLDEYALERSLLNNPHPNLITTTGIESAAVDALTSRNLHARVEAGKFVAELAKSGEDYAKNVNPKSRTAILDGERQIVDWLEKDIDITDAIFKTQTRRAAIRDFSRSDSTLQPFDALLESMPSLPADQKITLDALFKEDAQGIAPLDNPLTWQHHPDLLKTLAQNGELSSESRKRETSRGTHLLEAALSYLPTKSVIEQIQPLGLKIGRSELLTEDNKPTKTLDIIFSKGEVAQLFDFKNWVGQSKNTLQAFTADLPNEMRPSIPSLMRLSQQLDATRPGTQRGR